MIHEDELHAIMPFAKARIPQYIDYLNSAMQEFEIDTPLRKAAFIAQIAHESGEFRYVKEIASGEAYEGRNDLGNYDDGDGVKYKGRGFIQITGKSNYQRISTAFGINFVDNPEWLEAPEWACRSAAWWWKDHKCNEMADAENFAGITRRINGGTNGYAQRVAYYTKALNLMGDI
jgi:putative chitinase